MKRNYLLSIHIYMTIATTVAIKQFIRPNRSNYYCFELIGSNIQYWKQRIAVNDTVRAI